MVSPDESDTALTDLLRRCSFQVDPTMAAFKSATGQGAFADLLCGTYKSKATVAKVIHLTKGTNEYRNRFLARDQATLKSLKHPSLVTVYESKTVANKFLLLMEHLPGGSLCDLLLDRAPAALPESATRPLYLGVATALAYMHSKGLTHRNLKCEKVLLDGSGTVAKLSDFAFTRSAFPYNGVQPLLGPVDSFCGSASYVAPEVLIQESGGVKQHPYSQYSADVYSLGVVLYTMVHGQLPFRAWSLRLWIEQQRAGQYELHTKSLSPGLCSLIGQHLTAQPVKRPTAELLLKHTWCTMAPQANNQVHQ